MSSLSLDVADFPAFFQAIHGKAPFPWQARLMRLAAGSGWPSVLDLPTGSGKTAALDIAVFLLALEAGKQPRPSARRIIFVVDRRTIVDQAFERAQTIQRALEEASHSVVRSVRERLSSLSSDGRPLEVAQLRGGIARDDAWARTPDQPLIAVSTVDQVGSRLLFRGYGISDEMKPVHAGLLGHDVLYLLDEVHLSQPFRETLRAMSDRYRTWATRPLPGPFAVVEMSATPGSIADDRFTLDDDDRADAALSQRLRASKPVTLRKTNTRGFQTEVRRHVVGMLDRPGATVAVVVNRVRAAREIHEQIQSLVAERGGTAHLLTGRMRPFDRGHLETGLLPRVRAGRSRAGNDAPVVVVATQTIEAGADFDFDGVVTECASLDALRQRFGRLDRLGEMGGAARGVIIAADTSKDDPVYGPAVGRTWAWLEATGGEGGAVDFGIEALSVPESAAADGLLAPRAHAPILLPSHLDAWVQTSPPPDPDPDVSLWLHGPDRGTADVQVVWRADLDEALLRAAVDGSNASAVDAEQSALGIVESQRPGAAEAMSVPFVAARRWLSGFPEPDIADVEGVPAADDPEPPGPAGPRPAVLWRGEDSRVILPSDLRPGQTIVVPGAYGGIAEGNWSPETREPAVPDVAELAVDSQRRDLVLRLHPQVVRDLAGMELAPPLPGALDADAPDDRDVVMAWLQEVARQELATKFHALLQTLPPNRRLLRVERIGAWRADQEPAEHFVVRWHLPRRSGGHGKTGPELPDATSGSFSGAEVTLPIHQAGVAAAVVEFARRLGLPADVAGDLRLAGEWHDVGKADLRFQRWLHGGSEFKAFAQPEPLAKSRSVLGRDARRLARERAGYPLGTRHEVMSVALMDAAGEGLAGQARDRSLVWHLVASHHGYGRALAPWVPDPSPVDVSVERDGMACCASSAHELARLDSGVTERFWQVIRTYGWWGTAWLEAVFRLADHRQSEREQMQGDGRG